MFDTLVVDPELVRATRALFADGHHARAVEESMKVLNHRVRDRSGLDLDGKPLMETAFSVNNPRLKLNDLKTQSQRNQQVGYMSILAGCMNGIRNPRAHEHQIVDSPRSALQILCFVDHLLQTVNEATPTSADAFVSTETSG
ncbi:MAG: TIGR02391 family protein [Dehalococcoidia bacterium]